MKYLFVSLIIPVLPLLLLVVFICGAIYCGLENLYHWSKQFTPSYVATKRNALINDARAFHRT